MSATLQKPTRPQTVTLLDLPVELHHEIYDYIYTPWSLAIFGLLEDCGLSYDAGPAPEICETDDLFLVGPPGCNILLTCRFMYEVARHRFGREFTGYIGVGNMRRISAIAAKLPYGFRRWYKHVRVMESYCAQDPADLRMYFTRHFRHLRIFDCMIHNVQVAHTLRTTNTHFVLRGDCDGMCIAMVKPLVTRFYKQHPTLRWHDLNKDSRATSGFTLSFKVLATWDSGHLAGQTLGIVVAVDGINPYVTTRFIKNGSSLWVRDLNTDRDMHYILWDDNLPMEYDWIRSPLHPCSK